MAFVLVAGATGRYFYLKHLEGNVARPTSASGASSFSKDEAFNILHRHRQAHRCGQRGIRRRGQRRARGHEILLHVAKDRTNATAMSIPRDLIVDIPDCATKQEDGTEKIIARQRERPLQHQPRAGGAATPAAPCARSRRSPASRSTTS